MRQEKILNPAEELKLKARREEQREIARKLKAMGDSPEKIVAATGLSLKAVEKL